MKKMISAFALWIMVGVSTALASPPDDWWIDITNDRVEEVRSFLALGEDPNAISDKGQPSLMLAIQEGAWDVYDLLVRHRHIDVNITNSTDETPLMYLAVLGQTERAAELINRGAQVNRLGWTPLHYAASKAHADTVKLLLHHKAMVNAPSPDGTSPLMMAAYAGSEEIVRILLDAGADVTARNLQGDDAADWARRRHYNTLARQLDDLTQRVLQRRAAASGASASDSSTGAQTQEAAGTVRTLDLLPPPSEDQSEPAGERQDSTSKDADSTSRYFDLDRFEREDTGY